MMSDQMGKSKKFLLEFPADVRMEWTHVLRRSVYLQSRFHFGEFCPQVMAENCSCLFDRNDWNRQTWSICVTATWFAHRAMLTDSALAKTNTTKHQSNLSPETFIVSVFEINFRRWDLKRGLMILLFGEKWSSDCTLVLCLSFVDSCTILLRISSSC